jgi:hypothetical protein
MKFDIFYFSATLRQFMATMITSIATVGATAANTALCPTLGKLDAYLKNSKTLLYCVPNEHICAEIGKYIGLPIPPSGIVYRKGHDPEHFFASLNFNLGSTSLPPIDPARCVKQMEFEATGVVLFDMLIGNNDRHRGNLHLDDSQSPTKMTVYDHSHALFGHVNGMGRARLIDLRDKLGFSSHCLLSSIGRDAFFPEWIDRIRNLPNYLIDQACDATVPLNMITVAEAAAAKDFLKFRKSEIETIIRANKVAFQGIAQWSLLQ